MRQPFDLSLSRAVFKEGQHSIGIDSKILSQLWKLCLDAQASKDSDDVLADTLFEGGFEVKLDYTQNNRGIQLMVDNFSKSEEYAKR